MYCILSLTSSHSRWLTSDVLGPISPSCGDFPSKNKVSMKSARRGSMLLNSNGQLSPFSLQKVREPLGGMTHIASALLSSQSLSPATSACPSGPESPHPCDVQCHCHIRSSWPLLGRDHRATVPAWFRRMACHRGAKSSALCYFLGTRTQSHGTS